uniref:Uncharacterized protein n=1 Tax=Meloidogyne enterolobii TaxID=390850 RepID=A0A6V7V8R8_MELEN|nr:unnamed protein product [Meloidogyne enterolobii]
MSIIREYAAKIVTIIPIKPKKTSIIFKEIIGLKLHGYIFTILTSSKIISVFGREIFKKMFEKFKKMDVCYFCGGELTLMNYHENPFYLCRRCAYNSLNYQPPVQPNIAPSYVNPQFGQGAQQLPVAQHVAPSNVQQSTQLYTQQQQFINQFGQQAENIRTSESQAIKDRVAKIFVNPIKPSKWQKDWNKDEQEAKDKYERETKPQAKKMKFSKKSGGMDKLKSSQSLAGDLISSSFQIPTENIPVKNVSAGDPGPSCSATKKFAFELLIAVTGLENISVSKTGKVISIVDLGTNVDLGTYDLPSFVDTKTIECQNDNGILHVYGYRN